MKRKYLLKTILYGSIVVLSLYIFYKVTWLPNSENFAGIPAIAGILLGSLLFSINLFKWLIPFEPELSTLALMDRSSDYDYKKIHGNKFRNFSNLYIFTWILLLAGIIYWYATTTTRYRKEQLQGHAKFQKVLITDSHYKKGRVVEFDFDWKGKHYFNSLSSETIQPGDSVLIVFSTEDPNIVSWPGANLE
jgi:hypothetical protein